MATESGGGITGAIGIEEGRPVLGVQAPRPRARLPFHKRIFEWENFLGWGTIVVALMGWEGVARSGFLPQWAFPNLVEVVQAFFELLLDGTLFVNVGVSLLRQITGVILAGSAGVILGVLTGISPNLRAALGPLCRLLYPIPGIAWIPLAILWLGIGFKSTVFVVFFTGLWPTLFNTQAGILSLEAQYTDVAKVYLADRSFYIRHVVLPGSLPFILTGLRLTYGVGWRVIVGAELISSITGLGFMLDDARWQLRPDILVMGMGVIAVIGWSVDRYFFGTLERATLQKWGMQSRTV